MADDKKPQDDAGLAGKVAIVTGAGSQGDGIGNGRAAAILLARAGTRVLAVDRLATLAERTVEMIAAEGGVAAACVADVTEEARCREMVAEALRRFGRLDFLDNNVGIDGRGSVVEVAPEEWRRVMQTNVESMFLTSKHAIPAMIESAGGGAIVNVSSISALRPRGLTPYSASKGAVIALTRAMAVDHGAAGIRVNCVAPGPVYTPMVYASRHECGRARAAAPSLAARHRGNRVGRGPRRAFPPLRPCPLHHRPDPRRRRRRHPRRARAGAGNAVSAIRHSKGAPGSWHACLISTKRT